jgi:hypothetical protein
VGSKWFGKALAVSIQIFLPICGSATNLNSDRDPWSQTGRPNTPFDQPFYLILNVAVGGTGGYFL